MILVKHWAAPPLFSFGCLPDFRLVLFPFFRVSCGHKAVASVAVAVMAVAVFPAALVPLAMALVLLVVAVVAVPIGVAMVIAWPTILLPL